MIPASKSLSSQSAFDGEDEHSNVHIGELQWGSDPADMDGVTAVGVDVEADFLEGLPNQELNRPEWERGIEQNYALYGIHLDIERDDTIASPTDLLDIPGVLKAFYDGHKAHDEPTDLYLFVTRSVPTGAFGINWGAIFESGGEAIPEQYGGNPFEDTAANTHLIYASEIYDYTDSVADYEDYVQTPYTSELQLVAAGVELHELGHSFHIWRADDNGPLPDGEVYSGSSDDETEENLKTRATETWSIMRAGWGTDALLTHNGTSYHAFSLEELMTISFPGE